MKHITVVLGAWLARTLGFTPVELHQYAAGVLGVFDVGEDVLECVGGDMLVTDEEYDEEGLGFKG